MSDPRIELVGRGYDQRIDAWEEWMAHVSDDPRSAWIADLAARLSPGAAVLELGCGGGTAETALLADRFALTGVDVSKRQLERARTRVPAAEFVLADFTSLELEPGTIDAVVSLYVFNHVPRELLAPLLGRIHRWLRSPGWLLAVFGTGDIEAWTGEFVGAPTFFSSSPREVNTRLVLAAGFEIERDELVTIGEPEGPVEFQWILARR